MSQSFISKSAFIKAEQCLKHFYLYKNHPNLRDKLSKEKQLIFKRGTDVGIFAQQLFPNGIDVTAGEKRDQNLFVQKTKYLIETGVTTIYEATFVFDDLLVMVDILHKTGDTWTAYEVKSSLKITETYVKDACFQYYVIKNCVPNLIDFNLLTFNPNYVLKGELEISKLFKTTSVLKDADKNISYFSHKAQLAKQTLEQGKIPNVKIGAHCFQPYNCDFLGLCWKNIHDVDSIFSLGRISKPQLFEYYDKGIKLITEIDTAEIHKNDVLIQVNAVKTNTEQYNATAIKDFLSKIKHPYCSIDIEVWMPALPHYQNTKPFQQIPFLFSMVSEKDNELVKQSYFKPIEEDNRKAFLMEILKATQPFETILMYDKSLEETVLNQLVDLYPEFMEDVKLFKSKIIDLAEPIKQGLYYHPNMRGNFSLKSLSSIINANYDFDKLDVQSGIIAMYLYEALLTEQNPLNRETSQQQLIEYCELDALVTLELLNYYQGILNK